MLKVSSAGLYARGGARTARDIPFYFFRMLTDRQQELLEWLQTKQAASMSEIQVRLAVSAATAYREAHALVEAGLAHRARGGVKLGSPAALAGPCLLCGGAISPRGPFVLQLRDGSQRSACCPHCGLLALNQGLAVTALAADFLYGRMVNARRAAFLLGSKVALCCNPSVLCFASVAEARRFCRGFGGQVCMLDHAVTRLQELMAL
jgi:DeoR family transcriptional regulator, copper-sensing transcriptional repressor